ncbi:MAG: transglycosylase SLT domain-containing protein [Phototrophicaceae bacterium]|jgi:soluble lytic murein transglycosylase-like protein
MNAPRNAPGYLILLAVGALLIPGVMNLFGRLTVSTLEAAPVMWRNLTAPRARVIAPLFTAEVVYWEKDIRRWATEYALDPNLIATVMQIESCGHPTVNSYAGAQGLFQVMPFHFASGEDMLHPDTNALRGTAHLNDCLGWSNNDVGLALACYNGGPRMITNRAAWDSQVSAYYNWGTGIYADALENRRSSQTLTRWLAAGGARLCDQAADAQRE